MNRTRWIALALACLTVGVGLAYAWKRQLAPTHPVDWQRAAEPGRLSSAHGFLEQNCAACHTAARGADSDKCIACHSGNESLLRRQPTAFHASVGSCRECHPEHLGPSVRPTEMDHNALAGIGMKLLREGGPTSESRETYRRLSDAVTRSGADSRHPETLSPLETTLNCATCHSTKDRHMTLFGSDCTACHSTRTWAIADFRHPSPRTTDCAQCHQAPPSHYMMHFNMVSMRVAGQHHARVEQCYLCHQTTAWNDIKGVGWYKPH